MNSPVPPTLTLLTRGAAPRCGEFVLAVPTSWDLPHDQPTDLAATAALPWVWLPRHISPDYHDQVTAYCRANGFAPTLTHTAHSIASQLAMVACGLGVALVPERSAEHATGPPRPRTIREIPDRGDDRVSRSMARTLRKPSRRCLP